MFSKHYQKCTSMRQKANCSTVTLCLLTTTEMISGFKSTNLPCGILKRQQSSYVYEFTVMATPLIFVYLLLASMANFINGGKVTETVLDATSFKRLLLSRFEHSNQILTFPPFIWTSNISPDNGLTFHEQFRHSCSSSPLYVACPSVHMCSM